MPIDAFIAVGARGWVKVYGDQWPIKFTEFSPQVLSDDVDAVLGGAGRQLVVRLDYNGPCGAFVRLVAHPDGQVGRIVVAAAIVGSTKTEEASASQFLASVRPKWSPAR